MEKLLLSLFIVTLTFGTFSTSLLATPITSQGNVYTNGNTTDSANQGNAISNAGTTAVSCITGGLVSSFVTSAITSYSNPDHQTNLNTISKNDDTQSGNPNYDIPSANSIAYCVINAMIEYITTATIEWIKSGFDGNPAFVQDPKAFFSNIADNEAAGFLQQVVGETTGVNICQPFRLQIKTGLQNATGGDQAYANQSQCTLSQIGDAVQGSGVTTDYNAYTSGQSPNSGSLDTFLNVSNHQNNVYGSYFMAQKELQRRISVQQNQAQLDLTMGKGFLSYKKCAEDGSYTAKDGTAHTYKGACTTTTPGSVIENQLNNRLSSGNNRLILADKFDQAVSALVDQLIKVALNQVLDKKQ